MSSKISGRIWTGKEYLYLGKPNGVTSIDFERREFIAKCYTSPFPFDKVTFERDTGLKDKNGKEIYEGDIMQTSDGDVKYIVKWDENYLGYWGKAITDTPDFSMDDTEKYDEVIGNIHENPGLLKDKK